MGDAIRRSASSPTSSKMATTFSRHARSTKGRMTMIGPRHPCISISTAIAGTARFVSIDWGDGRSPSRPGRTWWRRGLEKNLAAGEDVASDLLDGARLARDAATSVRLEPARALLLLTAKVLE